MEKSAIYVRSSKDLHDVSCDAQEVQLKKIVKERGDVVVKVFRDKALSSTRDVRPEFDEMISMAMSKQSPFKKIYCLDTSRFGRDHNESQMILYELRRKHGIDVIFANMPNTGTYLDPAFEAIFQAFDYIHSQQSKAKGVASMKQNIRNGYRAGGQAPYGYQLEKIELGKHRSGDMSTKTKLIPDDKTSKFAREYFKRRANLETRRSILDDFYRRDIPSPTGRNVWPVSTAKSIEDNFEVYLGHTVFNRHNERIKVRGKLDGYVGGQKWRPRDEWVIERNTHEPLITEEIAKAVQQIKTRGLRDAPYNRRTYPMSGTMKCGCCGTGYIGDKGIYRCNSKSKPGPKCENNGISQNNVETAIFTIVSQKVLNFKNVNDVVGRIKTKVNGGNVDIQPLEKRLAKIEKERIRVKALFRMGLIDEKEVQDELEPLNDQRQVVRSHIDDLKASKGVLEISNSKIKETIDGLAKEVHLAGPKTKKRVIQALFHEILIFPKEGSPWRRRLTINGIYLPLTGVFLASPTGFEPVLPA